MFSDLDEFLRISRDFENVNSRIGVFDNCRFFTGNFGLNSTPSEHVSKKLKPRRKMAEVASILETLSDRKKKLLTTKYSFHRRV